METLAQVSAYNRNMANILKTAIAFLILLTVSVCTGIKPATVHAASDSPVCNERIDSPVIPEENGFYTLHSGIACTDSVNIDFPASLKTAWTAERRFFITEGPTFDRQGNIYFTPLVPEEKDDVLLVSLDGKTGKRRFAVGQRQVGQGGAPLVLNTPESGAQTVYAGGYEKIIAVSTDGKILWETPASKKIEDGDKNHPEQEMNAAYHLYGINYHAQADAVLALYANGFLLALDRRTGKRLGMFEMPGAPAGRKDKRLTRLNRLLNLPFIGAGIKGGIENELKVFSLEKSVNEKPELVIEGLIGAGSRISNYFAVDPYSERIWIASTMNDEADGINDGFSDYGALYGIDVLRQGDECSFSIACRVTFKVGSATTPSIGNNGERIYISDGTGNVMAIGRNGNILWSYDVMAPVTGSLCLSGREVYVSTSADLIKLVDMGDKAVFIWRAQIEDCFSKKSSSLKAKNFCIATAGINGVMIQAALCRSSGGLDMPEEIRMCLIDRRTGQPISSSPAVEETVSVIAVSPQGNIAIANSPVRRIMQRIYNSKFAIFKKDLPELTGGITLYEKQD
jgi:outer membrane protein assembly factor BamB